MIHLLKGYRGRLTNEQFIPPGVYAEDDPALSGLANYLVVNGHAVKVGDAASSDESESTDTKLGIEDMTLPELKEEANRLGLQFGSKATKAELIALIGGNSVEEDASGETA